MEDKEPEIERVVEYRIQYPKFKEWPLATRIASVVMLTVATLFLFGLIGLIAYIVYALI